MCWVLSALHKNPYSSVDLAKGKKEAQFTTFQTPVFYRATFFAFLSLFLLHNKVGILECIFDARCRIVIEHQHTQTQT